MLTKHTQKTNSRVMELVFLCAIQPIQQLEPTFSNEVLLILP